MGGCVEGVEWSEAEHAVLAKLWHHETREKLLRALPGRTWGAIRSRAKKTLQLRRRGFGGNNGRRVTNDPAVKVLRKRRLELGLTQEEVADVVGWDFNVIARAERGDRLPPYGCFKDWAYALGMGVRLHVVGESKVVARRKLRKVSNLVFEDYDKTDEARWTAYRTQETLTLKAVLTASAY